MKILNIMDLNLNLSVPWVVGDVWPGIMVCKIYVSRVHSGVIQCDQCGDKMTIRRARAIITFLARLSAHSQSAWHQGGLPALEQGEFEGGRNGSSYQEDMELLCLHVTSFLELPSYHKQRWLWSGNITSFVGCSLLKYAWSVFCSDQLKLKNKVSLSLLLILFASQTMDPVWSSLVFYSIQHQGGDHLLVLTWKMKLHYISIVYLMACDL